MPRVSIVLPCYNGARFLSQSINSILSQTFSDWELIIVNDCSTDTTLDIANEYARQDKRICVVNNQTNQKLPASLNIGFKKATGEYLTWTSDDNIAKSNWLDVLVNYLDTNPDTDMVSANMDIIDENGRLLDEFASGARRPQDLSYKCNVGAAFMYRRSIAELVGEYDTNTFCAEDYDYWCRIALNGRLDYIKDNIYQYRTNSDSLTATQQPRIRQKTALIQQKYRDDFIRRFNFGYYNRAKLDWLIIDSKWRPIFVLFDAYKFVTRQLTNILLFWNPVLRHKVFNKLSIKL
ncbi:MAG: glycosyltransferase [Alphaproteobacteria bacterium]|nr:glycosyltransferase [Alphaproteobacteria bacterium]